MVLSGCAAGYILLQRHQDPSTNGYWTIFQYNIYIQADQQPQFTLLVPVIEDMDGSLSDLMNTVAVVKGEANFSYNTSGYGSAMNITAKREVIIRGTMKTYLGFEAVYNSSRHPHGFADYSMWTNPNRQEEFGFVSIYCQKALEESIALYLEYVAGNTIHRTDGFTSLVSGWQTVKIITHPPPHPF